MTSVQGKVVDQNTGKGIYNAHVIFTDASGNQGSPLIGTTTNFDGYYQFGTLGGQFLTASFMGYKKQTKQIDFSNFQSGSNYSQVINFSLERSGFILPEVIITPQTRDWFNRNKALIYSTIAIGLLGGIALYKRD
ncbi:MAG: carboxypeptidase-like regulatory domain-containing protein [Bacteroidota bacterium]